MELKHEMRQSQALSQQQIQSMKILQMNRQELMEHINESVMENPLLDAEVKFEAEPDREMLQKLKWIEAEDRQNRYYYKNDTADQHNELMNLAAPIQEDTLLDYLEMQLDSMELSGQLRKTAGFVAANLNDIGYLEEGPAVFAECLGVPVELAAEAIAVIQSLEPAGVGAANITECLKLQLNRMEEAELAKQIVEDYLEKLGQNQYGVIAKALGRTTSQVREAAEVIRTLNPKPGNEFSTGEQPIYIRPDIVVVKFHDYLELLVGDYDMPTLGINSYYLNLLEENQDREVIEYLEQKVRQAKWLIRSIDQRRSTLLKCSQAILEVQEAFFKGQSEALVPLTMGAVSERIGMHESTVSRAIRGKYLQCSRGIFPMSYFFNRRLGNEKNVSAADGKRVLREIIDHENKAHPLSDLEIVQAMLGHGIQLSRRTVAKYRMELLIPGASGRRQI